MAGFDNVNIEGVDLKVPREGFASEETLQELVAALGVAKGNRGRSDASGTAGVTGSLKGAGKGAKMVQKSFVKMHPALMAVEKGFNLLGDAITGATGLIKSLAEADGSFESLGGVVDFSTQQITKFTSMIPILGGFLTALAEADAEITKLKLGLMDIKRETLEPLSDIGFKLSMNLGDLIQGVIDANISIEKFQQIAAQNADALTIFGGSANEAIEKFTKNLDALTRTDSPVGIALRSFGMNAEGIADELTDFIADNRFNRRLMMMSESELQGALLNRVKTERQLVEITGMNVQEQKAQFQSAAMDAAFQAQLLGQPFQEQATLLAGSLKGPLGDAFKQIMTFGTVTDEQTARLIALIPGLNEALQTGAADIRAGTRTPAEIVADIIQQSGQAMEGAAGKTIASFAMLDPALMDTANALMDGFNAQTRLNNLNAAMGTDFINLNEAVAHAEEQIQKQIDASAKMSEGMDLTGKDLANFMKEAGFDDLDQATFELIKRSVEQENIVAGFQSELFKLSEARTFFDLAIRELTATINDMLRDIGGGVITDEQAQAQSNFIAMNMEAFETGNTANLAYGADYFNQGFEPVGSEQLNNLLPPMPTQEEAMEMGKAKMEAMNNNTNNTQNNDSPIKVELVGPGLDALINQEDTMKKIKQRQDFGVSTGF